MELLRSSIVARLIGLGFIIASGNTFAQEYALEAVKAEMTLRLFNHVTWPGEQDIDSFRIAFMGTDSQYYNHLKKAAANRQVKDKNIQLTRFGSFKDLMHIHMLVVSANTILPFSEIALRARQTNTLLVSEEKDDQYIMINFFQPAANRISIKLNRANILLEQLLISNDIQLIGGTELDVARLYREMEQDLSLLVKQLNETQVQSSLVNAALEVSQSLLNDAQTELLASRSILQSVNEKVDLREQIISRQEATIRSRQSELESVSAIADRNQQLLQQQTEQLSERTDKILEQQEMVSQNEELLYQQQQQVTRQKQNIDRQKMIIRDQEQLLYLTLAVLLLFLTLVFWLYHTNQERKRISLELERRGMALEEEVRDRTTAAMESERHYRALSELSPVGVYQIDTRGNCRYVNERWCEYSGLTRQQAMGTGWLAALHPDDQKQLSEQWMQHLQTEGLFNSEHRYISPDGKIRWLLGRCEAEHDANGKLQGYIGTVADITDQKRLREQLRRTQKMDALGMLTGGIAHDYNNMLAIISGYADLLQVELEEQPVLLKYIDQIVHASARGAALTKKLLAFSRRSASDAKIININTMLSYQQQMLEKTLTPRIKLAFDLEEHLWPVWMDDGDLEDALVNISINAMHAMDGVGTLSISTKNLRITKRDAPKLDMKPGDYVLLSLTDTGIGMDEETKQKLFDPFYSTKGTEGTGLGLTQVYSFVERSKGTIRINSALSEGTQILIYFPRYTHVAETNVINPDNLAVDFRGSETVLIADDESSLLKLAGEILEHEGYKTICVNNGKEAVEVLQRTSIDLLLSDVIMPEMDGYQLANWVQSMYPSTRIQLISGFNDKTDPQDIDSRLIQNILHKPYHPQALLERVRQLLDKVDSPAADKREPQEIDSV